jgi:hypothetical protein
VTGNGAGGSTASASAGGMVDGTSVTRTFSLQELSNRSWEIDIAAQVEARTDLFAVGGSGTANASAGLYAMVSGEGVGEYFWTGTNTNIPAPEPESSAAVAIVCLAVAAYRVRER